MVLKQTKPLTLAKEFGRSDCRFILFPSRLYEPTHVPGAHFICPPAVPLVSPDLSSPLILCNDVSFLPLTNLKSQVSAIRADRTPVCVHVEEQRFRRRHACLLAVSSEELPL